MGRANRKFIHTIIEKQPDALRHAWHTLWEDPDMLLTAAQQDKRAMRHAGKAAWRNRDFVLAMVRQNWRDLRHASEELRGDPVVAREAIAMNPQALQYVSESLKEDPQTVYFAYQRDEAVAVRCARPEVFAERDFIHAAAGIKVPSDWVLAA